MLDLVEAIGPHSQDGEGATVILNFRGNLSAEGHEVVNDNADDMEAIGDDPGIGEPFFNEAAVGGTQIDANHPDPLPALERCHKAGQIFRASTWNNIEDFVVFEITESGRETSTLVESMLVDAQDNGAVEADALAGFSLGKLMIDAFDGGLPKLEKVGKRGGANAKVMLAIDLLAERLAAVSPGKNSGQLRNKRATAIQTAEAPGMDDQSGRLAKAA